MLFNSPLYAVFLIAVFIVFWLIRKSRLARVLFLVGVSYGFYFYGTYDAAREQAVPLSPLLWAGLCLAIIFVGSTLDFYIGRLLGKTENKAARKALLLVSIFYYLGVLALFKYWNFAADSFAEVAHAAGWKVSPVHLRLVLPFGISFFTFETMSYTIDVYRRQFEPAKKYLDYLLFVCFFPHLVAGPIVRPNEMLPQFLAQPVADPVKQARGLWLIATGLAKKIVIGDYLGINMVTRVFDNPERFSSIESLFAVYAYAVKIYADFSGYTDIALGSSMLFGYELPQNFDQPYTARNLQDFWHRWHMSLSRWLRDYLYVPLGGSRGSSFATYRNLMITMVLGGLWHGASWNFVIWGALHGGALAATRMWQRWRGDKKPGIVGHVIGVFLTFHYVCFCWIFFKAETFGHAKVLITRIGSLTWGPTTWGTTNLPVKVVVIIVLAMLVHFIPRKWTDWLRDQFARTPAVVQGIVLAAAALGLHMAAGAKSEPFVYGQF